MKTFDEIIKQEPVYMNDWESKFGVVADFEGIYISEEEYKSEQSPYPNVDMWNEKKQQLDQALQNYEDIHILFASYSYENYSGDAWVMFLEDGKLYEVNAGHCSCYGLEEQWAPEEVHLPELEHRLQKGTFGVDGYSDNNFKKELCEFLGVEFQ